MTTVYKLTVQPSDPMYAEALAIGYHEWYFANIETAQKAAGSIQRRIRRKVDWGLQAVQIWDEADLLKSIEEHEKKLMLTFN